MSLLDAFRARCDLVYVMPPEGAGGWILDAVCREAADRFAGRGALVRAGGELPRAAAYFFTHYHFLEQHTSRRRRRRKRVAAGARTAVLFTHPKEDGLSKEERAAVLDRADAVVSMSSHFARELVAAGVPPEKVHTSLLGADPRLFTPHERAGGAVGLCSAFYERKDPERVLGIVRSLPEREFVLMGRGWREWKRFPALEALENFRYLEGAYEDYPAFYDSIDVFVSPSRLEGGPVPLLEAMMANVFPVATRTGHAADLIRDGENGHLVGVDASAEEFADRIERAAADRTTDVRSTVEHLTWDRFAAELHAILGFGSRR